MAQGEPVTATSGTAPDAEGDAYTSSWEVLQHHDGNHDHPLQQDVPGESVTFNGPPSEGLFSTDPAQNYVEVRLTATEVEGGLSKTTSKEVRPKSVPLTFRAQPADLKVRVFGEVIRGERTVTAWAGDNLQLIALRQKDADGHTWGFRSWSDGCDATHTIQAPVDPATYTATFQRLRR